MIAYTEVSGMMRAWEDQVADEEFRKNNPPAVPKGGRRKR